MVYNAAPFPFFCTPQKLASAPCWRWWLDSLRYQTFPSDLVPSPAAYVTHRRKALPFVVFALFPPLLAILPMFVVLPSGILQKFF